MKKFLSALSFLLSILLLMLTAACEKSVDSKPENTVLQTEYESTVSQAELQTEKEKENNLMSTEQPQVFERVPRTEGNL